MWKKTPLFAAVGLVSLGALAVFIYATTSVINPAFNKIEQRDVHQNISRVVSSLDFRTTQLQQKVIDWSDWDDTYSFVENHNQAYIKSNLQDSALTDLGINFMFFYNEKQQLVEAKSVDLGTGDDAPIPPQLLAAFAPGSKLLAANPDSQSSGLVAMPGNTVQFFALPILTSEGNGPMHGTLLFGLYLSPDEIASISSVTQLNVKFWRLNDPTRPATLTSALGQNPKAMAITPVSATKIIGYGTINDVFGHPALVAQITQSRDIHEVAQSALRQYLTIILLDTVIAILIFIFLARIISLQDHTIALKNEFFSIASHELRTPLTVIRDYNQLMKFKFSPAIGNPEFDHMTDNVDRTSAQLIELVGVFLDAARLERGKIPFTTENFSLAELTNGFLPELEVTAKTKNLTISTDLPATLPPVKADKMRVQQIITNLIGNAMKFTDSGSITIKARAAGRFIVVYIIDTGRGMSKTDQRGLFQRFAQSRTKDSLHGSGLGLFISKKLVEQMGGTIKLETSTPGIGTTLSFTLLAAEGTPLPNTIIRPTAPTPHTPAPTAP